MGRGGDAGTRGRGDAETEAGFRESESENNPVTENSPPLRVSVSPCLRVSPEPPLRVSVSPCLRVSVSPCLRVSPSLTDYRWPRPDRPIYLGLLGGGRNSN